MRSIVIVGLVALAGFMAAAAQYGGGLSFVAMTDPYIFGEYIIAGVDQVTVGETIYTSDASFRLNFGKSSSNLLSVIVESRLWPFGRSVTDHKLPVWFGMGAGIQPIPGDGFSTSFYVSTGVLLFDMFELGFGILNATDWSTLYISAGFSLTF